MPTLEEMSTKPVIAIIGTGWAGFELSQTLALFKFQLIVISPQRAVQYTPLLASAACALFDPRVAEEPIRRRNRAGVTYLKATAETIDFKRQIIRCKPSVLDNTTPFDVPYDIVIAAPGCDVQTFDTPGVTEHAFFLKTTTDARLIQDRLLELLDAASLPDVSVSRQKELLSIRIVGGGPIGVEAAAELFDLWEHDLRHVYPHLDGKFTISIHDVAPKILGAFDDSLAEYALETLKSRNIDIQTGSHITRVSHDSLETKEHGHMPFGLLIWATGNKASPLVESLEVMKPEKGLPRILTDAKLRILLPSGEPLENAYALGDAGDIKDESLPTLAEVALQKAQYLSRELNNSGSPKESFRYKQRATMAYLGGRDGVVAGRQKWTGESAWLAWRGGTLGWTRSWRRKIMILVDWGLVWWGGRDVARY